MCGQFLDIELSETVVEAMNDCEKEYVGVVDLKALPPKTWVS